MALTPLCLFVRTNQARHTALNQFARRVVSDECIRRIGSRPIYMQPRCNIYKKTTRTPGSGQQTDGPVTPGRSRAGDPSPGLAEHQQATGEDSRLCEKRKSRTFTNAIPFRHASAAAGCGWLSGVGRGRTGDRGTYMGLTCRQWFFFSPDDHHQSENACSCYAAA